MLYLYAIAESNRIPDIPGLRGASLKAVGQPGLVAISSEHDELKLEPSEDELWAHERVVEDLLESEAVLPMRFGSSLPSEAAVLSFLDDRRQELRQALEHVRGAVELSVRVAIRPDPGGMQNGSGADDEQASGTAYLLDRLRSERRDQDVTAQVHEPLSTLARASTPWSSEPRRKRWKAAYLVSRDRVEAFAEQVDRLDTELGGGAVLCTGPWPPYSFSSGGSR
jgi:hypothetical protein